ncbi:MAG: hypothetical protein H7X95_13200 [Deltaproteobacteria bacterium]|nr:hypothetical protein [Deltaproteobacteria bacterium]
MNFGSWFPLDDALAAAPELPGVLQARADALCAYPKGRTAMLLYARCRPQETLRRYVATRGAAPLSRAAKLGARWIRFGTSPRPEVEFERLLGRFSERFGANPTGNDDDDDQEARSRDG